MNKQELYKGYLSMRYPKIDTIINGMDFSEHDLRWYIRFQDSETNLYKGFDNWLKYRELVDEIRKFGVNAVLVRDDVRGTSLGVEEVCVGRYITYTIVKTIYGDVWVNEKSGEIRHK